MSNSPRTLSKSCSNRNQKKPAHPKRRARRTRPDVEIRLDHETVSLTLAELADPEIFAIIQQRCEACTGKIRFSIWDLPRLPDETRYNLLSTIAGFDGRAELAIGDQAKPQVFENLFAAALAGVEANGNVERTERSRRAALESAALTHPDALEIACNQIAGRLREVGLRGFLPQSLIKQAKALTGQGEDSDGLTPNAAAKAFVEHHRVIACPSCEQLDADNETIEAEEIGTDEVDADLENGDSEPPTVAYYDDDFYVFQKTHWRQIKDKQLQAEVTKYLQEAGHGDRITTRFLADVLTNLRGTTYLKSSDELLPRWIDEYSGSPSHRSPYLAFVNGMINLEKLLEGQTDLYWHNPRHFTTVVLPYEFDPTADCPLWRETVRQILRPRGNNRQQRCGRSEQVFQEFMGYSLLCGDNRFEKFVVLHGRGANGKSTLMKTWARLLGAPNVSSVPLDAFCNNFRLHQITNKLANIAPEMNRMDKVAEGVLKAMVSGDRIQVDRKHKPPVTMSPTAKLVFGTNNLPPISDRSDGVWRRMIIMPFRESFAGSDCDRRREERLREELLGIFNWVIEGARRLLEQDGFTECDVCRQALAEHRHQSNPVAQFIDEHAYLCPNQSDIVVLAKDLYAAFKNWCEENGRKPLGSPEFGKELLAIEGITKGREPSGARRYYYTGISLSSPRDRRRRRRPSRPSGDQALGRH